VKIDSVKTFLVNADEGKTSERPRGRNWIFVKIATDTGITGVGEGGGWPEIVQKGIEEVAHFLIGENPFETERLWLRIYDVLHSHGLTGAVRGGVLSAIDMALWDIKGKALDVPVYELLGGRSGRRSRSTATPPTRRRRRSWSTAASAPLSAAPARTSSASCARRSGRTSRSASTATASSHPPPRSRSAWPARSTSQPSTRSPPRPTIWRPSPKSPPR
jgi:L-alanine-DL-glutamate epimerase-like enolase superfamily enzyme